MAEVGDTTILPRISDSRPIRAGFLRDLAYLVGVSWLRPQRAAERCFHWPLPVCFLVHLVVGIVGVLFLIGGLTLFHDSFEGLLRELNDLETEFLREPWMYSLIALGILLLVEAGLVALAGVIFAWGGLAAERLRDSLGHAIRQVWLRTPAAAVIALIVSGLITTLDVKNRMWHARNPSIWSSGKPWPTYPTAPSMPPDDPGYAAAMKKFQDELDAYKAEVSERQLGWGKWRESQPWYVRYDEPLNIGLVLTGIFGWVAGLLCAVGVRRLGPIADKTSLCLACGYDLSMTPMESRCPECGEAVASSLGEWAQPGAAWQRRSGLGYLRAWWTTAQEAVRRPTRFGRSLQLLGCQQGLGWFLTLHLVTVFFLGAAGILALAITTEGSRSMLDDLPLMGLISSIVGTMCVIGATLVIFAVASLVGWFVSLQNRRNLLPAARQAAVYATPYLVLWAVFGAILINGVINLNMRGGMNALVEVTGINRDFLTFLLVLVPNAVCGFTYLALVARGTNGARFANR